MHALLISLVLAGISPTPGFAWGPGSQARRAAELRDRVGGLMAEGNFDRAEQLVREAQGLDPRDDFHYALASIAGARGDCAAEVEHYERYFQQIGYEGGDYVAERYSKAVKRATERIEACRAQGAESDDPPAVPPPDESSPPVEPEPEPAEPAAPTPTDEPRPRRWIADPLGGVLVAGGIAAVGGGTAAIVVGRGRTTAAEEAGSEQGFVDQAQSGRRIYGLGIGLTAVGGVVLVGGIVRYALVARRGRSSAQARIGPGLGGLTLRW